MKDDLKKILKESAHHLQNNRSIVVFPQGARDDDLSIEKFNHIGILIAKKYHVPIVPIALHTNAWKPGRIIKDCGRIDPTKKVHVCFGAPRMVSGDGKDDHKEIFNFIKNLVTEWTA
jgi:1-acyl-sn-glycerol-3-phosphate acyltransferase